MVSKYRWFTLTFIVALGLDQLTKIWARHTLKPIFPQPITVIKNYFELRYSENTGAAFGMFRSIPGARYLLFFAGLAACFAIAQYLRKAAPDAWRAGAELGLLAGGLGNLIDRVAFGRVTDFIVWKVGSYEWPTFNIADAWLVVGVAILLIDSRSPLAQTAKPQKA